MAKPFMAKPFMTKAIRGRSQQCGAQQVEHLKAEEIRPSPIVHLLGNATLSLEPRTRWRCSLVWAMHKVASLSQQIHVQGNSPLFGVAMHLVEPQGRPLHQTPPPKNCGVPIYIAEPFFMCWCAWQRHATWMDLPRGQMHHINGSAKQMSKPH